MVVGDGRAVASGAALLTVLRERTQAIVGPRLVIVMVVAAASSLLLPINAAYAETTYRASNPFGESGTAAAVEHQIGNLSDPVRHIIESSYCCDSNLGFYNATWTGERCDGTGNNCGFVGQMYYGLPVKNFDIFRTPPTGNHVFRTRASWNDGVNDARFVNAVSPFISG